MYIKNYFFDWFNTSNERLDWFSFAVAIMLFHLLLMNLEKLIMIIVYSYKVLIIVTVKLLASYKKDEIQHIQ